MSQKSSVFLQEISTKRHIKGQKSVEIVQSKQRKVTNPNSDLVDETGQGGHDQESMIEQIPSNLVSDAGSQN